jgi:hypothetical protein
MPDPPVCPICKSLDGKIDVGDDADKKQCVCSFRNNIRKRLSPEIADAPPINASPLIEVGGPGEVKADLTSENLFIKGYWSDLAPHLRLVLTIKMLHSLLYQFQIITDARLRDVYVGSESYTARSRKKRDDIETNNSLHDVIGADRELVIIRLGFLGWANKAMPGILKEAIRLRHGVSKPIWIVEEPNSIFGPGHFSYDAEVAEMISQRFSVVEIKSRVEREVVPRGVKGAHLAVTEEEGMSLDAEEAQKPQRRKFVMPEPAIQAPAPPNIDMGLLTDDGKKKKYKGKRNGGNF